MIASGRIGHFIDIQLHVRDVAVSRGKVDSLSIQHGTNSRIIGSVKFQLNRILAASLQGNDQFIIQADGVGQGLSQVQVNFTDTLQLIGDFRHVLTDNLRINVTPVVIELDQVVVFLFHDRSFRRSGCGNFRRSCCGSFGRRSGRSFRRRSRGSLGRSGSRGFSRSSCGSFSRRRRRRFGRSCRRRRSRCLGRSRRGSLSRRRSRSFRGGCRRSLRRRFNRSGRHFGHFIFCIHHSRAGNQQGDSTQDGENLLELLHHIFTPPILLGD